MGQPAEHRPRLRIVTGQPDKTEAAEAASPDEEPYGDWDAVYLDNVGWLYRILFGKVGNRPDAEDLTTEVFLAALPRLRATAAKREVRSYLLVTARTVLAGHWKRTLGREITAIDPEEHHSDVMRPAAPEAPEAGRHVRRIMDRLPDRYRRILELRFLEACSIREAAHELGVSVANAKVLQHRALKRAAELGREV